MPPALARTIIARALDLQKRAYAAETGAHSWRWLKERGHDINPCRSRLHPAVVLAGLDPDAGEELSVQEAYSPESLCWGCGPSSDGGLGLQSFRAENGLRARLRFPTRFQAFPGIVNGGIVSVALDCHGNWTAAIALMDKNALPRPPFTLSASLQVDYHEPTPPDVECSLESRVLSIQDQKRTGMDKVTVEMKLFQVEEDGRRLLASGQGLFMKKGALRAL